MLEDPLTDGIGLLLFTLQFEFARFFLPVVETGCARLDLDPFAVLLNG